MNRQLNVFLNIVFLLTHILGFAQQPQIGWSKVHGQPSVARGLDIKATHDGNYVVLNLANPIDTALPCNKGMSDVWLFKMDPAGNILWERCYGGSDLDGLGGSIEPTADGGYIFATQTASGDGDVSGYHGGKDVWIVKLDTVGNIQWERSFGGGGTDVAPELIATADSGCVFVAATNSPVGGDIPFRYGGPFDDDAWLVKLNKHGEIVLNRIYGGTGSDAFSDVMQIGSFYYVVGFSNSPDGDLEGLDVVGDDGWLLKLDQNGEILLNKVYGQNTGEVFEKIIYDEDSLVIGGGVGGEQFQVEHGYYHGGLDRWVVKMDTNGNKKWQGIYGGTYTDTFSDIYEAPFESGYYVVGNSNSDDGDITGHHGPGGQSSYLNDYWIVKLSPTGVILWEISLGGTSIDECLAMGMMGSSSIPAGLSASSDGDVINPFFPNGQTWVLSLIDFNGVNEISSDASSLHIFPNPASANTSVDLSEELLKQAHEIRIFSWRGEEIQSYKIRGKRTEINFALPQGIYLFSLFDKRGKALATGELVIQ